MGPGDEHQARQAWKAISAMVLNDDRKTAVSEALGLSFARVRAIRRLAPGPLTLRALSEELSADPPYVTLMVDDLEKRGLVERKPHPEDRRAKLVTLTPAGRKMAIKAEQILNEPPAAIRGLSSDDLATLVHITDRLNPESL